MNLCPLERPYILAFLPVMLECYAMVSKAKQGPAAIEGGSNLSGPGKGTKEALLYAVALKRDRDAFIELFEYFAPRVKSFLMKSGINPEQADELAQETMLTVWNRAELYDHAQASASTWIFTIARNKRIDMIRKTARPEPDMNDPSLVVDPEPEPGEILDRAMEAEIMAQAINTLPEEQADLIRKSYFEEKTHDAIARETRLPLGTVKSRIRLALDRLRKNKDIQELWPQEHPEKL